MVAENVAGIRAPVPRVDKDRVRRGGSSSQSRGDQCFQSVNRAAFEIAAGVGLQHVPDWLPRGCRLHLRQAQECSPPPVGRVSGAMCCRRWGLGGLASRSIHVLGLFKNGGRSYWCYRLGFYLGTEVIHISAGAAKIESPPTEKKTWISKACVFKHRWPHGSGELAPRRAGSIAVVRLDRELLHLGVAHQRLQDVAGSIHRCRRSAAAAKAAAAACENGFSSSSSSRCQW